MRVSSEDIIFTVISRPIEVYFAITFFTLTAVELNDTVFEAAAQTPVLFGKGRAIHLIPLVIPV